MENKLTGALLLGLGKSRNYFLLVLLERGGGFGPTWKPSIFSTCLLLFRRQEIAKSKCSFCLVIASLIKQLSYKSFKYSVITQI